MKKIMHDRKRMSVINFFVLTILVWNMVGYEFISSYNAGEVVRCVDRERGALLRFKKGLEIHNSSLLSSWGSEDDKKECCEWEGIRCGNTTGHVTALFLNGLRGHDISPALLELHQLEDLDLSGNDFVRNIIPEFICSMTQLQQLNLSASNFSGIVPPLLGNLSNLQTLDLSWNDFGNSKIPEFIGSMKYLEHLNLGCSNFSVIVPQQLWNLTNLKTLDLSSNQIDESMISELDLSSREIPKSIGSMKKLEELNLRGSNFYGIIPPQIGNLTNLKTLDLSGNYNFEKSTIPEFIGSMKKLEHLKLYSCNFHGILPHQLGNLTNLRTLDLSWNDFEKSKIPEFISSMIKLEELNLGWCYFSGIVPPQIGNLTSLQTLDLSDNSLLIIDNLNWLSYSHLPYLSRIDFGNVNITDPNWLKYVLNLPSLQEIIFQKCGLLDAIKPSYVNFSSSTPSLYILDLSGNGLTSSTIDWLLNHVVASSLRELHLQTNKLKWLPTSIWQLPKLEMLDVSFNSLEGTVTDANLTNLHNLNHLDLSSNSLVLKLNPNWTPPFQLDLINLGGCGMGPHFPLWLRTQTNLESIDLSVAGLTGEVPKWFWDMAVGQYYLNLSHNHLSGIIYDFSTRLSYIDVSFNEFSGPIPLFSASKISELQLSQNMFSGSISSICAFPCAYVSVIDLSNNQFIGEIPNCWENMTRLSALNLANNRFFGEIPRALGSLFMLSILRLGNNKLSGELPSTLKNCKNLGLIDVGDNMLTGNIPSWIGAAYSGMTYLIFHNNRFEGSIPLQICSLTHIKVLDLSGNHLSGKIPPCFYNFTLLVQIDSTISHFWAYEFGTAGHDDEEYVYSAIVSWKGQYSEYRRTLGYLTLIDLSSNRLVGDIPRSLFSLRELISLNLSRNRLTGNIHPDIGEMKMLEVLDLSSNHLSGVIPNGMAQLHFLAVLNFSNNNLSGKIPKGGQLDTFNASSYSGNTAGLCGSPLLLCPGEGSDPSINNKSGDFDDDDGILSFPFLKGLVISIILGFILGFWGVVGSLVVKDLWRRAYFNFWDAIGNWLYVTTAMFWAKLIRRS